MAFRSEGVLIILLDREVAPTLGLDDEPLQPTSPVRRPGTIDQAIELLLSRQVDCVVPFVDHSPFLWRDPLAAPKALYGTTNHRRRQDLRDEDRWYRENGSYLTTRQSLGSTQNRIGEECALSLMSPEEGIDIETPADLIEANSILRNLFPGTRE